MADNKNQKQQKMKTGKRIDNAWMMAAAAFGFAVMTHSASAATTILISPGTGATDDIKNGGFESGSTGNYPNYTVVTDWVNFGGGTGVIAAGNDRERTGAYGGSVAVTLGGASHPAVNTSHTIAAGDLLNLTFYHGRAEDWDAADTIGVFLYSTAGVIWTTTVSPTKTSVVNNAANFDLFTANNIPVPLANIGQTLFLRFESNATLNEYAAVDDITLTVSPIPEPSAALLGGLGLLALLRRRRS
jgi:MYXO-CTERM domain-containing protein